MGVGVTDTRIIGGVGIGVVAADATGVPFCRCEPKSGFSTPYRATKIRMTETPVISFNMLLYFAAF
jgi:hypothetical protein